MAREKKWGLEKVTVMENSCTLLKRTGAAVLLLSGVLGSVESHAVEAEVPLMEKVVVTASRQEEKVAAVPANITVISEQEIANSPAETVPGLLRSTAGILVNDITGNGRNITVDLRGFGETAGLNTLLLIDGRRVNHADLSGVDWTLIPKDRIKQIEIIHGGRGSVLYGDNAAGGVVNIITKTGEENRVSGGLVAGSYQSLIGKLAVSGSTEKLSYALDGSFLTTDGYRDNSGTDAANVGLNLEYFFSDRFEVAFSGGYHEDDTEVPGALLLSELDSGIPRTGTTTPDDFSDTKDYYSQISPVIYFSESSYFKLDASARRKQNDAFFSFLGGSFDAQTEIDTLAVSPQIIINEKLFDRDSKFIAGLDYRKDEEDIDNQSEFFGSLSTASYGLSKEDVGLYGNAELSATDKLSVSGGLRYDEAEYTSSSFGVDDSVTMDETLYNAGLTYRFLDNVSTYLSYSKSFRYPVLDEMFSFFNNSFDSSIAPQTTDDFEVGARVHFGSDYTFSINLFRLDTEKEIFFNPATYANENFDGDTIRQGVELKASKRFSKVLLYGSYTLRDTEIDGGIFDGNEIPNVPRHQFALGGEASFFENIKLYVDGTYIGERPYISDFANSVDYQDSYFYAVAKLAYMFEKGSAYITVNNLLDEEYSQYGGLNFMGEPGIQPSPGVNFMVGLTFDI